MRVVVVGRSTGISPPASIPRSGPCRPRARVLKKSGERGDDLTGGEPGRGDGTTCPSTPGSIDRAARSG
ncbi:MAG TPA: hypothetical protein DCQ98_18390 [Planctomycetaceae bacterium]|nr:hypothetical protein [Planctomycetaceae bacterium]